jgi:hypothetical protein
MDLHAVEVAVVSHLQINEESASFAHPSTGNNSDAPLMHANIFLGNCREGKGTCYRERERETYSTDPELFRDRTGSQ